MTCFIMFSYFYELLGGLLADLQLVLHTRNKVSCAPFSPRVVSSNIRPFDG